MDYYLFCQLRRKRYIEACLKKKAKIKGIILWNCEFNEDEKQKYVVSDYQIDKINNLYNSIFIVESKRERERLLEFNIEEKNIIIFYTRKLSKGHLRNFKIYNWLLLNVARTYRNTKLKYWAEKRIMIFMSKELGTSKRKFALVGLSEYSKFFIQRVKDYNNFVGLYALDEEIVSQEIDITTKSVNELVYEKIKDVEVYIMQPNYLRKTEEQLIKQGFPKNNLFILGDTENSVGASAAPINAYDERLGYTRIINGIPGYIVFKSSKSDNPYKILILGNSTSDPTTMNIKSWSECLFDNLCELNIDIEIYSGGISAYTVEQELEKLLRDGMVIRPHLVLSYSGINNTHNVYNEELYPYTSKYQTRLLKRLYEEKKLEEFLRTRAKIEGITFGLTDDYSCAEKWVRAEKLMHGICKEFEIVFHGFLQPYNHKGDYYNQGIGVLDKVENFYKEAKDLFASLDYIHNFQNIFDNKEEFFYDLSHVYESGNQIIAEKILPLVLDEYNRWQKIG